MANVRVLAWAGADPVRIDAAHVTLQPDRLSARGTSATGDYALDWWLDTDAGWVTRRLSVRARAGGWSRALELTREPDGSWSARDGSGDPLDVAGLEDALDCDLGLCPMTNTMPVLRHDLVAAARAGDSDSVDFTMAWVAVPELTVHASQQRYTPVGPADDRGALIRYASGDFVEVIDFDADGLVRDYPGLGRRIG